MKKQPAGVRYAGRVAISQKGKTKKTAIREGTAGIADRAFKDNAKLEELILPAGPVYIEIVSSTFLFTHSNHMMRKGVPKLDRDCLTFSTGTLYWTPVPLSYRMFQRTIKCRPFWGLWSGEMPETPSRRPPARRISSILLSRPHINRRPGRSRKISDNTMDGNNI